MGTRTASWGASATTTTFQNVTSLGITLDTLEYPTGVISLNLSGTTRAWYSNGGSTVGIKFYLCDSSGGNAIELFTVKDFSTQYRFKDEPKSVTISNTSKLLKGKALYVKAVGIYAATDNAYVGTYGKITITINTGNAAVAVVKGNKIMATDYTQTGASVTAGSVIKISGKFSSGDKAEASTFNSKVLGL